MVDEYVMSPEEWRVAVRRELDRLGLTYDDLACMSARRDFVSLEARKLWLAIGGRRP